MFSKVITIIAGVTVAIFILAAHWQTPDPSREDSDGISMPLTKHSDTDAHELHATTHDSKIIRGPSGMNGIELNMGTPHPLAVERDGFGAGIDLTKFVDGIWYATISIGTPPKSFTVQLNTGTSDLIVPASTGDENCRSHSNLWDPTSYHLANLHNMWFSAVFADSRSVSGQQHLDNVTIAGLTVDVQTIGAATRYSSGMSASVFAPDGILGLAFPPQSKFHDQSPLFQTLFNENKLHQPLFALTLTDFGGELFLGGTNTALYRRRTLVYTPVTSPYLWQLNIDDIRIDNRIILTNVPAIIDTGANFVYGDVKRVFDLHQAGGGSPYGLERVGYYTFPCATFPTVTFTIGGRPFDIPPESFNRGRTEWKSRACFSSIVVLSETHEFWSIGTLFLELFYTVFDFNSQSPRIGFAELAAEA